MNRSSTMVSRREERIYVSLPVILQSGVRGGFESDATTIDFSERGLRLRTRAPLNLGEDVGVVVHGQSVSPGRPYRVVWVRGSNPERPEYEVGLYGRH